MSGTHIVLIENNNQKIGGRVELVPEKILVKVGQSVYN